MGKRLFLALNPDEESRRRLAEYAASIHDLLEGLTPRWIDPDLYHLTLWFFGDVEDKKLEFIEHSFSVLSSRLLPPVLILEEPLFLPSLRHPRVLSLRFSFQAPTALDLILRKAKASAETDPGDKPWLPHLSLARFRYPQAKVWQAGSTGNRLVLPPPPRLEFQPVSFELMESFLYPSGPRYEIRKSYYFA